MLGADNPIVFTRKGFPAELFNGRTRVTWPVDNQAK